MSDHPEALRWDLFCRVIDNHGDLGVCWRLASRLAALGQAVRLWVDDASALDWMAPGGARGVTLEPWRGPAADEAPGDVVIEAFGCNPPPDFIARMAATDRPPVWINLEYLSAEPYVARCHALPSPQSCGPGAGLRKWFFYPGFTPETGGLLHEDGLAEARAAHDPAAWLPTIGVERVPGARLISLFCYEQPALAGWLAHWQQDVNPEGDAPRTQLLVTPGAASAQVAQWLGERIEPGTVLRRGALQVHGLPWLPQAGFDRLLWSCDLNHVRGEDSLVRALWAGRPFLWQLYPQEEAVRLGKLDAFLDLYLQDAPPEDAARLRVRFRQWNEDAPSAPTDGPGVDPWTSLAAARTREFEAGQQGLGDLAVRLQRFVASKR